MPTKSKMKYLAAINEQTGSLPSGLQAYQDVLTFPPLENYETGNSLHPQTRRHGKSFCTVSFHPGKGEMLPHYPGS